MRTLVCINGLNAPQRQFDKLINRAQRPSLILNWNQSPDDAVAISGEIDIAAHSFALQLALLLMIRHPVRSISLLDPVYHDVGPREAFGLIPSPDYQLNAQCLHRQPGGCIRLWPFSTYYADPSLNTYFDLLHEKFPTDDSIINRVLGVLEDDETPTQQQAMMPA